MFSPNENHVSTKKKKTKKHKKNSQKNFMAKLLNFGEKFYCQAKVFLINLKLFKLNGQVLV